MLSKIRSTLFVLNKAALLFGSDKPLGKLLRAIPEEQVVNLIVPRLTKDEQQMTALADIVANMHSAGLRAVDLFNQENVSALMELVDYIEEGLDIMKGEKHGEDFEEN